MMDAIFMSLSGEDCMDYIEASQRSREKERVVDLVVSHSIPSLHEVSMKEPIVRVKQVI